MSLQFRLVGVGFAGCAAVTAVSSMQQAVRDAKSVHFQGQQSVHGLPVGVDTGISRSGDISGSITENGAKLQVLNVDGKAYFKATEAFLKQVKAPASTCTVVCGHWVELPPQEASQLTGQLTMDNLTGNVATRKLPTFKEGGSTTVNGQPAWVLKAPNGSTIDVSSVGKPYPLQATPPSGGHGVIRYSQWNAVPTPAKPPSNQVINLSGLQH
jgi:hypothetical protein